MTLATANQPLRRRGSLIAEAVIVLALIAMIAFTWRTWPDPVIDFGRELYVPWQLAHGKVLYRDIAHFNGPLSAYFNSLIFRVIGPNLIAIALTNIAILLAMLIVMHRLLRAVADGFAATLACVAVTVLLATGQPGPAANYNFICPYSHELTHGIALSIGMIASLQRFDTTRRMGWCIISGVLLGLVLLTKVEVALAALVASTVGLLVVLRRSETRWIAACVFAIGAILPVLLAILALSCATSFRDACAGTFSAWRWALDPRLARLPFYQRVRGTFDLADSAARLGIMTAGWCAVVGVPLVLGLMFRDARRPAALVGSGVIAAALLLAAWRIVPWEDAGRPLILSSAAMAAASAAAVTRGSSAGDRLRLILGLFALLLLAKCALNVRLDHYGFALGLPALALTIVAANCWLPGWLNRSGACGAFVRGATTAALLVLMIRYLAFTHDRYAQKTVLVGASGDAFWSAERGRSVNALLGAVESLPPDATIAVIPEGAMINYLSRRANSTPFIVVMPPEALMFGADGIAQAYQAHPPDYIVIIGVNLSEYGVRSLPEYVPQLTRWIERDYPVVQVNMDPAMQWMIRRRK